MRQKSAPGGIDLGPTHVELDVGALFWPLDGSFTAVFNGPLTT